MLGLLGIRVQGSGSGIEVFSSVSGIGFRILVFAGGVVGDAFCVQDEARQELGHSRGC